MDTETQAKIDRLKYYAIRLSEIPAPDLNIEELERVLEWQIIPANGQHVYEYALLLNLFIQQCVDLDLSLLDPKTRRFVQSTLQKIAPGAAENSVFSEILASTAGIVCVNLVHYYSSNWILNSIGIAIPFIVTRQSFSKVLDAKVRHELMLGHKQTQIFLNSVWSTAKWVVVFNYGYPVLSYLWKQLKLHPWRGSLVILGLPAMWTCVTHPVVKGYWIDAQLAMYLRIEMSKGWLEFTQKQVLDKIWDLPRKLKDTFKSSFVGEKLGSLWQRIQRPYKKPEESFVYPANFQHTKNIRLLRIKRKLPFTKLEAELIEADLEETPLIQYHAISHVWNHTGTNRTMILNGKPFSVSPSVYDICCKSSSYFSPRTIWIDNICINQDDDDEKVSQIKKMRDIYYEASIVQIYLVDAPSSWLAVPFMQVLLRAYGASKKDCSAVMIEMLLRKKHDKWLRARIDSLVELLSNRWFERVWVIQEFVSAREIVVNYGNHSFDWTKFTMLAQMIEDEEVPEAAQLLTSGGNRPGGQIKSLIKRPVKLEWWRGQFLIDRWRDDFGQILSSFQSCRATQWQDRIFALIGLSTSAEKLWSLIDYRLPKDKMLLEVAHHLQGWSNLFDTFPFAGLSLLPTYPTNLPSWVADWTASRDIDPIVAGHNQKYAASKERDAWISGGESYDEIIISGVLFDTVTKISEAELNFTPDAGTLQSHPELIDTVLQYFASALELAHQECVDRYQPLGKTDPWARDVFIGEAVSRTMIGNAIQLRLPIIWGYQRLVPRFLDHGQFIKNALEKGKFEFDDIYPLPQGYGAYEKDPEREEEVRQLMKDIDNARWLCGGPDTRRKFAVTKKGCMGMMPRTTMAGDLICILYGCKVPMVLRKMPSCDAYQLVGESYVHGIMEGEGMEHGEEMRFKLR